MGAEIVKKSEFDFISLDEVFERAEDFDALNQEIVFRLLSEEEKYSKINYLVPYSPETDLSVQLLLTKARQTQMFCAAGHTSVMRGCVGPNLSVLSAYHLGCDDTYTYDKSAPLVIYDVDNRMKAGEVKLFLTAVSGEESRCLFYDGQYREIYVYEIDRQKNYDYRTHTLVLPQTLIERKAFSFSDLLEILNVLRAPNGCPWDSAQTHESIRSNLVEEAYELVEAIDLNDPDKMEEESGDVLMQAAFHAEIAKDAGEFTPADMLKRLCEKLIFRHSHIFGTDVAKESGEALDVWEKNKRIEKNQSSLYDALKSLPKQFPALLRLYKVLKKAEKENRLPSADLEAAYEKYRLEPRTENFFALLIAAMIPLVQRSQEPEVYVQSGIDALIEEYR